MLTACATRVPQALTPQIVPEAFNGQATAPDQVWPQSSWWTDFGSPELSDLIARAQASNRDLAIAAQFDHVLTLDRRRR